MPAIKARFWSFTLNNPKDDEVVALRKILNEQTQVRYAIFGKEVGESNATPHLQGYVAFKSQKTFNVAKTLIGERSHIEKAKGNEEQNVVYCSKEDTNAEEFGSRHRSKGRRTDLECFKSDVKDGEFNLKTLRESHSEVMAKYERFCNSYIRDNLPKPELKVHVLRLWQVRLKCILDLEPNDRTVVFVVDPKGNAGKSWFAKWWLREHEETKDSMILRPTKHADMAYALQPIMRVLFLDCTRKQIEYLPYTFMEECKDGLVFSNKYESCIKEYPPMHVVVLMNENPDKTALSEDRYLIIDLGKNE